MRGIEPLECPGIAPGTGWTYPTPLAVAGFNAHIESYLHTPLSSTSVFSQYSVDMFSKVLKKNPILQLHDELVLWIEAYPLIKQLDTSMTPRAVETVPLDDGMADAAHRLLNCLCSPLDTAVLGESLVREITYYALLGENGHALYALTQEACQCAHVAKALTRIHHGYAQPLTVDMLAEDAKTRYLEFFEPFL